MSATTWPDLSLDAQATICRAVRKALETGGESTTFGIVHRLAIGKPRRDVPTHIVQSALETMLADGRVTVATGPRGAEMWRARK